MDWKTGILLAVLGFNAVWDIRKREIHPASAAAAGAGGVIWLIADRLLQEGSRQTVPGWLPDIGKALLPGAVLLLFSKASGGKLGGGDALLVCVTGLWGGAGMAAGSFLTGLALTAAAGPLILRGKTDRELPFVPFLLAGYVLCRFVFLL